MKTKSKVLCVSLPVDLYERAIQRKERAESVQAYIRRVLAEAVKAVRQW